MFFRKQKIAGNDNQFETERREPAPATLIGAGTVFDGNLTSDGEVRVDGLVRGSVRSQSLVVAIDGEIEGDVSADSIVVHGRVKGPLRARHVHLEPGAHVEGDITSATIAIETGARLSGAVWQEQAAEPSPAAAPALSYREPPELFGDAAWPSRRDAERPLSAVKPRLFGSGR